MRVMTYNVRSCRGMDGRVSPERIAEVIAAHRPDLVALQELDKRLVRTGRLDQAQLIARALNMQYHFHPSFALEEGYYGNAVLSRFPMEVVRAGKLPTLAGRRPLERRGALWVRCTTEEGPVEVLTTHLGLHFREKIAQARELVGTRWLGDRRRASPTILCGDLNVTGWSPVHRMFRRHLRAVAPKGPLPRGTFPSRFPVLTLDHIFVSREFAIQYRQIARGALERMASDHLPLICDMKIKREA